MTVDDDVRAEVSALLRERERRGLRFPAIVRIALLGYSFIAVSNAAPPEVRGFALTMVGVVFAYNVASLWLLRQDRWWRIVGYVGAAVDACLIPGAAIAWSQQLVSQPDSPAFLFKTPLPTLAVTFIVVNSLAMRPIYPFVVSVSALLTLSTAALATAFDERTIWAVSLRDTFTTPAINPTMIVNILAAVLVVGASLVLVTRAMSRTIREAVERQAEHNRLQREQARTLLEGQMRAQSRLVAGISHEMNSPLGAVRSSVENSAVAVGRLREGVPLAVAAGAVDRRLSRVLDLLDTSATTAAQACDRLTTTVETLRRFTRLDEAERQRIDVVRCVDEALAVVPTELQDAVEVVKRYEKVPPIAGYPSRLNQVFTTLLTNACEAMQPTSGGTLTIVAQHADGVVRVAVADTGRGIAPEALPALFEIGMSGRGARVSAGFGLAAGFAVVREHGGEIFVESELGAGTTFTVALPVVEV